MERLANIDIAETGHHGLIEEGRLQGRFLPAKAVGKIGGGEHVAERLNPDTRQKRMAWKHLFSHQIHDAEPARIGIDDALSSFDSEDDMVMCPLAVLRFGALFVKFAKLEGAPVAIKDGEASGHTEMDEEGLAIVEVSQNVFGPPL